MSTCIAEVEAPTGLHAVCADTCASLSAGGAAGAATASLELSEATDCLIRLGKAFHR